MIPVVAPVYAILARFGRALRRGFAEAEFRGLLYMVSVILTTGTLFYRLVEEWSWVDSLFFSVVTLTTVGYGNLTPTTTGSKLFTVVFILIGIGLLLSFIERVARYASEDAAARAEARRRRREER